MTKLFGNGNSLNLFFTQFLNNLQKIQLYSNLGLIIALMIKMMRLFRNENNVMIDFFFLASFLNNLKH